jgi:nucleoid-associated protein YgaU
MAPPPAEEASAGEAPPPPSEEPAKVSKKGGRYSVASGDSLWRIAGRSSAYGNSFKWPLLFKANRDIIEDPDLIYPRQKLEVKKSYTESEMDDAVGKAKETPPFEPHSVPRKKLPIKY